MARKINVNGSVVIYTAEGTKVLDAEVRHVFNMHGEWYKFKFDVAENYLLIGGARTVPTDNYNAPRNLDKKNDENKLG